MRYWIKSNKNPELCPICKSKMGHCHIGEYCSNDNCEGNYVDGMADLNEEQLERFKDIVIGPWQIEEKKQLTKK
jgi:hypothetical protein